MSIRLNFRLKRSSLFFFPLLMILIGCLAGNTGVWENTHLRPAKIAKASANNVGATANNADPSVIAEGGNVYLPIILRKYPWVNPLGFEATTSLSVNKYITRVNEFSPGWVRINKKISWRELQPKEGDPINWDLLEKFEQDLKALKLAGAKPIVIVDDYPRWATIIPNSCSPLREDKFPAFADFLRALVNRYSTAEFNVYDWELGNEVDVDPDFVPVDSVYGCWGDVDDLEFYGGDYYGEMIKVVGKAIKEESKSARVWLGGLMISTPETTNPSHGKPEHFIYGILEVGAAQYFDVVSFHGHVSYYGVRVDSETELSGPWISWGGGNRGKIRYLRDILKSYGLKKTLFLSEAGVGCPEKYDFCQEPTDVFFQFQADQGIRTIVRVLSEKIEGFIWYTLNGPGWRYSGLLNKDGTPKPVYIAYNQLREQIWKGEYFGPVDYGDGVDAYAFEVEGKVVHIVWAEQDGILLVNVPKTKFLGVYDRDGNEITPSLVGDNYQIEVGFSPIYIQRTP